jgi:hypothetical protein
LGGGPGRLVLAGISAEHTPNVNNKRVSRSAARARMCQPSKLACAGEEDVVEWASQPFWYAAPCQKIARCGYSPYRARPSGGKNNISATLFSLATAKELLLRSVPIESQAYAPVLQITHVSVLHTAQTSTSALIQLGLEGNSKYIYRTLSSCDLAC